MRGEMQIALAAVAAVILLALLYWRKAVRGLPRSRFGITSILVPVGFGLGFIVWSVALEKPAWDYARKDDPLVVVVAFDLSPSMLAIPDPRFEPGYPPRFERAKSILLQFLAALEERNEIPYVSMVGFTREAEILMGWDRSVAQIRQILQYGLAPDLFGSSGTSIESAAEAILDVFDMLPAALQGSGRKVAIFVSDGEDTQPSSSLQYALESLTGVPWDVVSLQAGLLATNEGIPRYSRAGEFLGYRSMNGREYTVPDVTTMRSLAKAAGERGLYLRAENGATPERMLAFVEQVTAERRELNASLTATLGLFAVISFLCARLLG